MALREAYLTLHRETDSSLSSCGITADQFVVLTALRQDEARTQRELVERTSSDPSTLRAMLVLLEKKGLVERPAHPTDGRARRVKLTAAGRQIFEQAWSLTNALRARISGALQAIELENLIESLETVVRQMAGSPAPRLRQHDQKSEQKHPGKLE